MTPGSSSYQREGQVNPPNPYYPAMDDDMSSSNGIYEMDNRNFKYGIFIGSVCTFVFCLFIFMLGCFFNWWPVNLGKHKDNVYIMTAGPEKGVQVRPAVEDTLEPEDSKKYEDLINTVFNRINDLIDQKGDIPVIMPVPEPEPAPVYDMVTGSRYLTTIAQDHYGNSNFWPYIYMENENVLRHPDQVTPGTKLVVPQLSKYGVDPTNKADENKAKQKAIEIYARYPRQNTYSAPTTTRSSAPSNPYYKYY